jgi:hypothetical protein
MLMMLCTGEWRLRRLVTCAVEADHQPVADELVVAHARNGRQILQPFGMGRALDEQDQYQRKHDEDEKPRFPDDAVEVVHDRATSKRHEGEEEPAEPAHHLCRIDESVLLEFDSCIGDLGRRHGVVVDVERIDDPGESMNSSPWLIETIFSPETSRLPLG